MSKAKELEIQLQFLDEAQEYLSTLESALLGLANSRVNLQKVNAALRAAHSIKGGAGMMGFKVLSQLAHRLEDSFKVLKTQKDTVEIDVELEELLLSGVDCLRQVIQSDRETYAKGHSQPTVTDPQWLDYADILFDQLQERLGDPQAEDVASILSPEEGQDVLSLLFETEVEGCLQRLEGVLADANMPCLSEELSILAQELGGLGEMLELSAFISLCESVTQQLEANPNQIEAIARQALQAWRRSQALILTGNLEGLPTAINGGVGSPPSKPSVSAPLSDALFEELDEDLFSNFELPVDTQVAAEVLVSAAGSPDFSELLERSDFLDPLEQTYPVLAANVELPDVKAAQTPVKQARSLSKEPKKEPKATDFRMREATSDKAPAAAGDTLENTVRVPVKQLNQLNDLFGELTIERNGLDLHLKRIHNLVRTLGHRVQILDQSNSQLRTAYDKLATQNLASAMVSATIGTPTAAQNPAIAPSWLPLTAQASAEDNTAQGISSRFDILEMDRYDSLHLLSQEVMETIVQIREVTSDIELGLEETDQTFRELNKTTKQLQTSLTQVRMRPLSDIVDRFPRALRELSLQYNKSVELNIQGNAILVDRNILEALSDPLMHLFRNAFDHGIEDPETRKARGKSERGLIEIRAAHHSNRTLISISDDGGGIPLEKIRARAVQMGLDKTLLAAASDEDLLSLIFEPGFSTTDQVTTLSGRGVGMDVVRDNLRQIRGEIKVDTRAGMGTTFTLSVPFTLSVVRVLLAESNGMLLAFPTDVVEEMLVLQSDQVLSIAGSEVFRWGDTMIPLIRLYRWLEFHNPRQVEPLEAAPTIAEPAVLLLNQNSEIVGMQVERCWGEQEVAIRQVEGNLPMPSGFTSCTILGDGRVVPLVNASELLHWIMSCERSQQIAKGELPERADSLEATSSAGHATPANATLPHRSPSAALLPPSRTSAQIPPQKTTILIVDDSINVRRFLALTLEKAGYRVEQAKDGQEALEKLLGGLSARAVICDIEMPRLDGYGFLSRVKSNPTFEKIPVAMLTSRSGEKHRQLAISLGANAYFSKPYNEQVLLRTLEQIISAVPV